MHKLQCQVGMCHVKLARKPMLEQLHMQCQMCLLHTAVLDGPSQEDCCMAHLRHLSVIKGRKSLL